jgi:hypothetical protein
MVLTNVFAVLQFGQDIDIVVRPKSHSRKQAIINVYHDNGFGRPAMPLAAKGVPPPSQFAALVCSGGMASFEIVWGRPQTFWGIRYLNSYCVRGESLIVIFSINCKVICPTTCGSWLWFVVKLYP